MLKEMCNVCLECYHLILFYMMASNEAQSEISFHKLYFTTECSSLKGDDNYMRTLNVTKTK